MITPLLAVLTSTVPMAPAVDELPDWISFYSNMRLRMESTLDQSNGEDRHRGRMRFRAGAKFQISDELKAEVRLSTFSGTAGNPHWDIGGSNGGDTLAGSDVVLDRINMTWQASPSTTVIAGKMGAPLKTNPVYGEWLWDGDIQPAGIAGVWAADSDLDLDLRLGHFIVDEENGAGASADPAITILQLNLGDEGEDLDWGLSTTLWNWTNEGPVDYLVWDTTLSASMDDLTGSVQFFQNLDDDTGDDTGMAFGLKYGAGGTQGSSQIFGSYFDFDANATNFAVGQDDVPIGPSATEGLTGFVAGWQYWWRDNVTFKVWALQGDDDTDDPLRLRFDIDVNFKR